MIDIVLKHIQSGGAVYLIVDVALGNTAIAATRVMSLINDLKGRQISLFVITFDADTLYFQYYNYEFDLPKIDDYKIRTGGSGTAFQLAFKKALEHWRDALGNTDPAKVFLYSDASNADRDLQVEDFEIIWVAEASWGLAADKPRLGSCPILL